MLKSHTFPIPFGSGPRCPLQVTGPCPQCGADASACAHPDVGAGAGADARDGARAGARAKSTKNM